MAAIKADVTVNTYHTFVDSSNIMDLIKDYDFTFWTERTIPCKIHDQRACVMARTRETVFTCEDHPFRGRLMTYVPGQGPCRTVCVPEPAAKRMPVPTCKQAGVIGTMGGVIEAFRQWKRQSIIGQGDLLTGRLLTMR